jgi:hypothetical protein
MPTTRPGYIWSGTEWVEIGQSAVVAPVAYQASAPSTPATGDIWIDSDEDVPSVDSTLYYRWTKTMSGGETSLSGTDNNSLSLKYTPGYESVFINGVLQARNLDYTATSGSTISGLTALVANDIVMVESIVAYSVGDTYTQTAADARFAPISGALLQTQLASVTTGQSISSTSFVALTNLLSVITPKYATSKILITMSISGYSPNATNGHFAIYRGGTQLVSEAYVSYQAGEFFHHTMYFIDTPGSISAHTYQGYAKKQLSGDNNFTVSYGDVGGQTRSTIMVQEIAA